MSEGLTLPGPRITVDCDCGTRALVPYGDALDCSCGRRWDTSQIPRAEYAQVLAVARRHRRNELLFVATVAALLVALVVVARSAPLFVTIPIFLAVWVRFFRPWWTSRRKPSVRGLPQWQLRSDPGTG